MQERESHGSHCRRWSIHRSVQPLGTGPQDVDKEVSVPSQFSLFNQRIPLKASGEGSLPGLFLPISINTDRVVPALIPSPIVPDPARSQEQTSHPWIWLSEAAPCPRSDTPVCHYATTHTRPPNCKGNPCGCPGVRAGAEAAGTPVFPS